MKRLLLASGLALAACGQLPGRHSAPDTPARPRHDLTFSPNGEPLSGGSLGPPACAEAMGQWVARIDSNHDGIVDRQEFMADADAQFKRMDLDHDGFITSDELSTFRAPFMGIDDDSQPLRATHGADPVMSADGNLDFRVSHGEFLKQAADIFDYLNGKLDLAGAGHFCPAEPAARKE